MKKFDESVANLNLKLTIKLEAMKIQCISDQDAARIMQAEPLLQFKWEELELKVLKNGNRCGLSGLGASLITKSTFEMLHQFSHIA